jgi:O-antigen/teichoic acid export membrane protein
VTLRLKRVVQALLDNDPRKIGMAIFSEGMLSFSSSLVGILVAKFAIKSEYGMYVILFSIISLVGGYQNALFSGPMMVLIHGKDEAARKSYVAGLARGAAYAFVPVLLSALAWSWISAEWHGSSNENVIRIGLLCAAVLAYLSKEFVRTLNFVTFDTGTILRMDLLNLVVVFAGLGTLIGLEVVSANAAMLVLASAYLAAFAFATRHHPHALLGNHASAVSALKENWAFAKWAITGSTCSLLQDRGYIFIVSLVLSLDTLADLAAARLFFMPLGMLSVSIRRIAISKGSKLLALDRRQEFRRFLFALIALLLLAWLSYSILILLTWSGLVSAVLGAKYSNTRDAMMLWGVFFLFYTVRSQLTSGLAVYRHFKRSAQIDMVEVVITLTACVVLVFTVGRLGAVLALVFGQCLSMVLYLRAYLAISHKPQPMPVRNNRIGPLEAGRTA